MNATRPIKHWAREMHRRNQRLKERRTGGRPVSNYPPGVTGNEYEIAGPDFERESDQDCARCGSHRSVMEYGFSRSRWLDCSDCGYQTELPGSGDDWDDPADDDEPYE